MDLYADGIMRKLGEQVPRIDKEKDFSEVRGNFDSNSFVTAVVDHIRVKEALGNELLDRLAR